MPVAPQPKSVFIDTTGPALVAEGKLTQEQFDALAVLSAHMVAPDFNKALSAILRGNEPKVFVGGLPQVTINLRPNTPARWARGGGATVG